MDHGDRVEAVEREAAALVAALRAGSLDVPVPSCPGWTLVDLAGHVGNFTVWAHVLCEGSGRPKPPFPDQPDGPGVVDWVAELFGYLVGELRATPPDTEVWTWVRSDKTARFIARRAANELAIHRYDAQLARGTAEPIDPALAADGIEEIFVMHNDAEEPQRRGDPGSGETLHLHGAEGDEWLLTLGPEGVGVERRHAKGDLALRGAVSDLELLLYQRPTIGEVERFGDETVLDVWYRQFTF